MKNFDKEYNGFQEEFSRLQKEPFTRNEIGTAIQVLQSVAFEAGYGKDPDLCRSSNKVIRKLKSIIEKKEDIDLDKLIDHAFSSSELAKHIERSNENFQ